MPCTGVEHKLLKHITESRNGRRSTMLTLWECIPKFVNMAGFPWAKRNCTWLQTEPLSVWIGRVLLNVRFCILGIRIILYSVQIQFKTDVPLVFSYCRHNESKQMYTLWWEAVYVWFMGIGWGPQVCRDGLWCNGRVWILRLCGDVLWKGRKSWKSICRVCKHVPKLKQESSGHPSRD